MPETRTMSRADYEKKYGSLSHLESEKKATSVHSVNGGGLKTITSGEFKQKYGRSPMEAQAALATDSIGEPWERGLGNLQAGFSDAFFLLKEWAEDIEEATGFKYAGDQALSSVSEWFMEKAERTFEGAEPATGKYAKGPENFLGYLNLKRAWKVAGENIPLMGAFVGSYLIHPAAGTALMFGVEGGSAMRSLVEYEERTGKEVPKVLKWAVPVTVGAVNVALEKTPIDRILKTANIPGLKGKLVNIAISSLLEGTTEGAQEIMQALGEYTYEGELPKDTGERFIESLYAGLVLGLVGGSFAGAFGEVGKAEPRKKRSPSELDKSDFEVVGPEYWEGKQITEGERVKKEIEKVEDVGKPRRLLEEKPLKEKATIQTDIYLDMTVTKRVKVNSLLDNVLHEARYLKGEAFRKELVSKLSKLVEKEKYVYIVDKLERRDGRSVYGTYLFSEGRICIPESSLQQKQKTWVFSLVAHEVIHHLTVGSTLAVERGKANTSETNFVKELEILRNITKRSGIEGFESYLSDATEFVAGALSDRNFQAALVKIKAPTLHKVNLWENLVEALKKFLNLSLENTVLQSVLAATGEHLEKGYTHVDYAVLKTQPGGEFSPSLVGREIPPEEKASGSPDVTGKAYQYALKELPTAAIPLMKAEIEKTQTDLEKARSEGVDLKEQFKYITHNQFLKEALGAKIGKHIEYTPEEGFREIDFSEQDFDRVTKAALGLSIEAAKEWSRRRTNANQWFRYWDGKGPAPDFVKHNPGFDVNNRTDGVKGGVDKEASTDDIRKIYFFDRLKHINLLARRLLSPEITVKNLEHASKNASDVIEGDLFLRQSLGDINAWIKELMYNVPEKTQKLSREALKLAYVIQKGKPEEVEAAKARIDELVAQGHSRLHRMIDGQTKGRGLIDFFEFFRRRYIDSLISAVHMGMTDVESLAIQQILEENLSFKKDSVKESRKRVREIFKERVNVDERAQERYGRLKRKTKWIDLPELKKESHRVKVLKGLEDAAVRGLKDIEAAEGWGVEDYITNVEIGSYRILSPDGTKTLGFARNVQEAKKRARQIRIQEQYKEWPLVRANFAPINPTKHRKNVLSGMDNIMEVLPRYAYAMEKRIVMAPIVAKYNLAKKENPGEYTREVKDVIQNQIDAVVGAKYSWGEEITDNIMMRMGWEAGGYSRGVGLARKVIANLKLGYRPTSALVNAMGGFGHTWVAVGNQMWKRAFEVSKLETYTLPDGTKINPKEKLKEIESQGALGIDISVGEAGEINLRSPLWHPMGLFQLPERHIRPHSFMANYLYHVEIEGMNNFEATEAAKKSLRFQQFTYNISAIPYILRSPGGKLVGQFRTYLIKELEFISTLRGRQIPRYVGLQLAMAGPRGVVYLLRSLPVIGALGLMDEPEKWMVKGDDAIAKMSRGIGGLVGGDISAAATFQFPMDAQDWGGAFLSTVFDLHRDVILPSLQVAASKVTGKEAPAYVTDKAVDWITSLTPLMYYWKDLEKSVLAQGGSREIVDDIVRLKIGKATADTKAYVESYVKNYQKPDVWIRDTAGNRAYKIGGLQDRLLLLIGAAPLPKSQYQVLKRIWRRDMEVAKENRQKWYTKVIKQLQQGREITPDMQQDAILYRVDPRLIPDSYRWREMTPQQRETLRTRLFNRAEALEHFGIEK